MSVFQIPVNCDNLSVDDIEDLLGISRGGSYLMCHGRLVSRTQLLQPGQCYHVFPRILGGKGGFGSMLRAIGAQIEKTTSREACRDLSGRRIRDVNNEKKLKEWVMKQADREREKREREERRRAKRQKFLDEDAVPSKLDNPQFDAEYAKIMKNSEQALQEGLAKMKEGGSASRKRKAETTTSNGSALDKCDRWDITGGLKMEDLSSDSSSDNDDDCTSAPTSSTHPPGATSSSSSSSPSPSSQEALEGTSGSCAASETVTSSSDRAAEGPPAKVARLVSADDEVSSSVAVQQAAEGAADTGVAQPVKKGEASQSSAPCAAVAIVDQSTEPIDLDQFPNAEALQGVGLERLKADLLRRGLKCGGNLQERAQRLFSVKGLRPEDIPAKLLAKGKGQGKSSQK